MKTLTAIFGSDQVNLYGMIMPVRALESALNQAWDKPLPSSIGHDIHRAAGWNQVVALHLQPKLSRVFGIINYAENSDEMDIVRAVVEGALQARISDLDPELVAELRGRVGDHLSSEARLHPQACIAFLDSGIAARRFPDLFDSRDDAGLVPIRELNCVGPGVFEKEGLLIFAHPYFRRSLSRLNTLNDPFLSRLSRVAGNTDLDVRIALDENLIGHPATLQENIELQYWWGPKFSDDLSEVKLGVTRHEGDKNSRFFNGVSAAEFWWYGQGGLKTFECEEIRDLDSPSFGKSQSQFGCRFIHSILDAQTGVPNHLDGAIRLYNETEFLERVDKDIMHFGRRAEYSKLWRIDGPIPVESWKELISDYYRDNHLVGEYFGGVEDGVQTIRPKTIELDDGASIHDFAPCTMADGDGVRIAISYHSQSECGPRFSIYPTERYDSGDGWVDYVEASTIEFIKLLRRSDIVIELAEKTAIVAFEDMVSCLPLIIHCGSDSTGDANISLSAIRDYCVALKGRDLDRMFGFHISVRFEDRDAHFSFAGHVNDLSNWLESCESRLPQSVGEIGAWADAASSKISKLFPNARNVPPLENMLKRTGLLTTDRKFLEPGEFTITDFERYPFPISLVDCPSIRKAAPLIEKTSLAVTYAMILKSSECRKCKSEYRNCECIKFIDADVTCIVKDAEPMGVFWTDRSAWDMQLTSNK